ncbi:hypothetical protein [Aestuariibaculum sp. M13]|uniref:hypothetical protein n=1 Tax=Aestuariibaculum sp. M13 TaxID=2967132 RepID=UPI00280B0AB8|nr:hypothetical protein [Aestuariibaculum sp. M13]
MAEKCHKSLIPNWITYAFLVLLSKDEVFIKYGYSVTIPKMKVERACIYPKDIQRITGRSERYGRKLLNDIRAYLGKSSHQFITVQEFSEYTGIEESIVLEYL